MIKKSNYMLMNNDYKDLQCFDWDERKEIEAQKNLTKVWFSPYANKERELDMEGFEDTNISSIWNWKRPLFMELVTCLKEYANRYVYKIRVKIDETDGFGIIEIIGDQMYLNSKQLLELLMKCRARIAFSCTPDDNLQLSIFVKLRKKRTEKQ